MSVTVDAASNREGVMMKSSKNVEKAQIKVRTQLKAGMNKADLVNSISMPTLNRR